MRQIGQSMRGSLGDKLLYYQGVPPLASHRHITSANFRAHCAPPHQVGGFFRRTDTVGATPPPILPGPTWSMI